MLRKTVSGIMLTLLFISMLSSAFIIQPAKSEWIGTVYIRADGRIDPPDAPITTIDNVTYTLINNITSSGDGIVIERDNIILDGANYTVQGTRAHPYKGVNLNGRENVTIKNLNIKKYYYGIYLWHSYNNRISGNNVANNVVGIYLYSSYNNRISGNNITIHNYDGIHLYCSSNNTIFGNNITASDSDGIYLYSSYNNRISGNNVANNVVGIWLEYSYNNRISGNNITANYCYGIRPASSSNNVIYHNNFVDNTEQVKVWVWEESVNIWDNGYPSGGNYWSDYKDVDEKSGPYQNETGSDGIWDHPHMICENNVDHYPFVKPFTKFKVSELLVIPTMLSCSSFGVVRVDMFNGSSPLSIGKFIAVPEGVKVRILCEGALYDTYTNVRLENREVTLLVDGQLISSDNTGCEGANVNLSATLELPYGLHNAEVRFEGDDEYLPSSYKFKIIAYRSSSFNITRDAYRFSNWPYSFDEHLMLCQKLIDEELLDKALKAPFLALFPLTSLGGHCFGMAASSSAYYLAPSLKPKPIDVYEMDKDDALWDVNWYQLIQLKWLFAMGEKIDLALNDVKSLINSGRPVLLLLRYPINHAITITGYYEQDGKTFLMTYDNKSPSSTISFDVLNGKLIYWDKNVTRALFIDPNDLPPSFEATLDFLKEIFKEFFGVIIHSPVDIKITSESGKTLVIENNTITRNDFPAGYFYIAPEEKIILLPSNETYSLEATGTSQGEITIECSHTLNDQVLVYQYQNITVIPGTRFYLPTLDSKKANLDIEGDGVIDEEIEANIVPEFPTTIMLTLFMLTTLIATILLKKRRKTKPQPLS